MSQNEKVSTARKYWKLIPGFAISAYFLWRVLRDLKVDRLREMRLSHPVWIGVFVAFIVCDYALRGYRWWYMLRPVKASYRACVRVLLTSLAANNILPFRIGDFMRIFAYAPDVNAPSSTVLSTVLLERLLDIFMLFTFFVVELQGADSRFPQHTIYGHSLGVQELAIVLLMVAAVGLGALLFGTRLLQRITHGLVARFGQHPRTKKLGEWASLLFDAVLHLTFVDRIWLVLITSAVWFCESVLFISAAKMVGIESGVRGPWLAASLSNLSFMLPSAPGGIGPFEGSAKLAMQSQGAMADDAALFAVLVHVLIWFAITAVGGIGFLVHRAARGAMSKPLTEELAAVPVDLEVPETH
ncbi:putative integral membrane protein [Terriglobus roseus DSM 18391]|uniref:Putative integral membrane protein n=1 Tax=Terriglobus roseus (strain DSM 18391 / NRRL B-41598 / KBS 63) TaxID=926566 RepID=I3ZES7_TERRK|nr:lysylphosphatidylglycerol synthase transmembrane domain-containing protein [Terriglobus roseus]AFL87745.1 putative integral membrane protein [Terriglobus roseus DSM 18391]